MYIGVMILLSLFVHWSATPPTLYSICCLLQESDVEIFRVRVNVLKVKNSVLDPKRAKFIQKSYGKFTESLRNLPRPVQEDP